jgi:cytochrome c2
MLGVGFQDLGIWHGLSTGIGMCKHLMTLGIWACAALVIALLHWPTAAPKTSVAASASSRLARQATPASLARAEYGRALFMAKGCATCHTHAATSSNTPLSSFGPSLTSYHPDPAFLRQWLRDPQALRPNTQMPDLDLKQEEIDSLIAFLLANQQR